MFAECIKAVRAVPAPVVMYRVRETGWERAEGGRIKNTEGRSEKEDDGTAGGVPEDRRRCGLRPTYRFGGLTFRGDEGIDGRSTHTRICVYMLHTRLRAIVRDVRCTGVDDTWATSSGSGP